MNNDTNSNLVNEQPADVEIEAAELEAIAGGMLACNKPITPCV